MSKILACAMSAVAVAVASPAAVHAEPAGAAVQLDVDRAKALAKRAFVAYGEGEIASAIALYEKAYQASPIGIILLNLAAIYDKDLGDKERALEYYQRYLRSSITKPAYRKRASERVAVLLAEIDAARQRRDKAQPPPRTDARPRPAPEATASRSPRPPVAERGAILRVAGLTAATLGVGGFLFGGVYGLMAKSRNDLASEMCNGSVCFDPRGVELTDGARRAAGVSTASFVIGGVLAGAGIGLFLYHAPPSGARVLVAPGPGGLAIAGTWR